MIIDLTGKFELSYVGGYTAYYLLGWYLSNIELSKVKRIIIYVSGCIGVLITIIGTQCFTTNNNNMYEMFYSNTSVNILSYSVAFFLLISELTKNKKDCQRLIMVEIISKRTFGVYLLHVAILDFIYMIYERGTIGSTLVEIILVWLLVSVLSFIVAYIMSKIPYIKKLIKC